MLFRFLDQNKVGTFLLLTAVGAIAFWSILATVFAGASINVTSWAIPATLTATALAHLTARPLVRHRLGLNPLD